jgi:hypothetical protein
MLFVEVYFKARTTERVPVRSNSLFRFENTDILRFKMKRTNTFHFLFCHARKNFSYFRTKTIAGEMSKRKKL